MVIINKRLLSSISVLLSVTVLSLTTTRLTYGAPDRDNQNRHWHFDWQNDSRLSEPVKAIMRMIFADSRISITGMQTTVVSHDGKSLTSMQRISRAGIRGIKIDYVTPPDHAGEVIVDDGVTFWHYIPSRRVMEQGPSKSRMQRGHLRQMISQFKSGDLIVTETGSENIAGRECRIIALSHKGDPGPHKIFWIDKATGLQLKIEKHDKNGSLLSSSFFTSIQINATIPPGTFIQPTIPSGVTIKEIGQLRTTSVDQAQAQAGFAIRQPSYLPAGYQFKNAEANSFRGRKMVALRYSNGLNTISLFQTPENGPNMPQPQHPHPDVAILVDNGRKFVIVGNLPSNDMDKMLQSIK